MEVDLIKQDILGDLIDENAKIEQHFWPTIGDRILNTLKRIGMSQREFSRQCGALSEEYGITFSPGSINGYIHNRHTPTFVKVTIMARVLGVSPQWLMGYNSVPQQRLSVPMEERDVLFQRLLEQVKSNGDYFQNYFDVLPVAAVDMLIHILSTTIDCFDLIGNQFLKTEELRVGGPIRGRKRKNITEPQSDAPAISATPKRRGRPRKIGNIPNDQSVSAQSQNQITIDLSDASAPQALSEQAEIIDQ